MIITEHCILSNSNVVSGGGGGGSEGANFERVNALDKSMGIPGAH